MADMTDADRRRELGQQFRVDSVRMSAAAKSGHPTSAMSAADLMAVLVDGYLRFDFDAPKKQRPIWVFAATVAVIAALVLLPTFVVAHTLELKVNDVEMA